MEGWKMTLLTNDFSTSVKTRGCAITYRAGHTGNQYKTCPTSCPLNPTKSGSRKIDIEYTKEVANAVPRGKEIDCVVVVPSNFWDNKKNKVKSQNINIVRCPAEYIDHVNCGNCGGNQKPLCAIQNRSFIIVFTVHGNQKKKAEDTTIKGGCYASGGNVNIHWKKLSEKFQEMKDHTKLKHFVSSLPSATRLRHHVAGDLGKL